VGFGTDSPPQLDLAVDFGFASDATYFPQVARVI
jgi:hypothetical protein